MHSVRTCILCIIVWLSFDLAGQDSRFYFEGSIKALITKIQHEYDISFVYSPSLFDEGKVLQVAEKPESLEAVIMLIRKRLRVDITSSGAIYTMRPLQEVKVCGYVKDSLSGESLPYAWISLDPLGISTQADASGYFVLSLPVGRHRIQSTYLGSQVTRSIDVHRDRTIDIIIDTQELIAEVIITEGQPTHDLAQRMRYTHEDLLRLAQKTPGNLSWCLRL